MFADVVISEAREDIKHHSAESMAPKFWDIASGEVCLGMHRRSTREVLKEIDETLGVYPVVSTVRLEPRGHLQEPTPAVQAVARPGVDGGQRKSRRGCRDLCDFVRDPEASISLWTVPLDHASVPTSERRGEIQDEDEEQPGTTPHGKHAPKDQVVWTSEAIRIALDFTTSKGQPMRRTGTILLRSQKMSRRGSPRCSGGPGPMGWSVCWDSPKWFAGMQVGLSIPMPLIRLDSGSGTASDPIEVQDEESRFALLVWMERKPKLNVAGNAGADRSIVSMLFKKQEDITGQSVKFTEEEERAFGIGLSEEKVKGDFEWAHRSLFS